MEKQYRDAQGYPGNQPFNVAPRRCQSKRSAWFQVPPYHNNKTNKKSKEA